MKLILVAALLSAAACGPAFTTAEEEAALLHPATVGPTAVDDAQAVDAGTVAVATPAAAPDAAPWVDTLATPDAAAPPVAVVVDAGVPTFPKPDGCTPVDPSACNAFFCGAIQDGCGGVLQCPACDAGGPPPVRTCDAAKCTSCAQGTPCCNSSDKCSCEIGVCF